MNTISDLNSIFNLSSYNYAWLRERKHPTAELYLSLCLKWLNYFLRTSPTFEHVNILEITLATSKAALEQKTNYRVFVSGSERVFSKADLSHFPLRINYDA